MSLMLRYKTKKTNCYTIDKQYNNTYMVSIYWYHLMKETNNILQHRLTGFNYRCDLMKETNNI